MSTTEILVTSSVCAFALGFIVAALAYEWSYRRVREGLNRYRTQAINAKAEADTQGRHRGTPYIRTAPGVRVLYSADWLND